MRDLWYTLGPLRFFLFFGTLTIFFVGLVAVHMWLSDKIGWPEAYGVHCRGKGCLFVEMFYSYRLLDRATFYELFLFGWIWFLPAGMTSFVTFVRTRRWLKRRRDRISPLRP